MRTATVALVIGYKANPDSSSSEKYPFVMDVLSDDREIEVLEARIAEGVLDPLNGVYVYREEQRQEDEAFADYVEELLSRPCLRTDVQEHGVQWLRSRIRIEQFQQSEQEAARIIAEYAFHIFKDSPERTDFFLAGASTRVRIRVFDLRPSVNVEEAA